MCSQRALRDVVVLRLESDLQVCNANWADRCMSKYGLQTPSKCDKSTLPPPHIFDSYVNEMTNIHTEESFTHMGNANTVKPNLLLLSTLCRGALWIPILGIRVIGISTPAICSRFCIFLIVEGLLHESEVSDTNMRSR